MVQKFPRAPPPDPAHASVRFYPGSAPGISIFKSAVSQEKERLNNTDDKFFSKDPQKHLKDKSVSVRTKDGVKKDNFCTLNSTSFQYGFIVKQNKRLRKLLISTVVAQIFTVRSY